MNWVKLVVIGGHNMGHQAKLCLMGRRDHWLTRVGWLGGRPVNVDTLGVQYQHVWSKWHSRKAIMGQLVVSKWGGWPMWLRGASSILQSNMHDRKCKITPNENELMWWSSWVYVVGSEWWLQGSPYYLAGEIATDKFSGEDATLLGVIKVEGMIVKKNKLASSSLSTCRSLIRTSLTKLIVWIWMIWCQKRNIINIGRVIGLGPWLWQSQMGSGEHVLVSEVHGLSKVYSPGEGLYGKYVYWRTSMKIYDLV